MLKTLKDFHKSYLRETSPSIEVVSVKTLKQEAIKWVKMFQSRKNEPDYKEASGAEESFKNFFNITEEDLK